jgi:hypothetical protein
MSCVLVPPSACERCATCARTLCRWLTPEGGCAKRLGLLGSARDYAYLNGGNCIDIRGVDDAAGLRLLEDSLSSFGVFVASNADDVYIC